MAEAYFCDGGCGAVSPDPKTRLHVANKWLRVRAGTNVGFDRLSERDDMMFCGKCEKRVLDAIKGVNP